MLKSKQLFECRSVIVMLISDKFITCCHLFIDNINNPFYSEVTLVNSGTYLVTAESITISIFCLVTNNCESVTYFGSILSW